jgi:hypothetical protein
MGLSFKIAAVPRQHSHSQVWAPRDSWPHFTVSDSRLSQPGGPGPLIYVPRDRVARLYSQALGFLFVTSYSSQGYIGGIRPRLITGHLSESLLFIRIKTRSFYYIENTTANSSSIVACVFIAMGMYVPSCCLSTLGVRHRQQGDLVSILLFFSKEGK